MIQTRGPRRSDRTGALGAGYTRGFGVDSEDDWPFMIVNETPSVARGESQMRIESGRV
jgi:hypothetical protein